MVSDDSDVGLHRFVPSSSQSRDLERSGEINARVKKRTSWGDPMMRKAAHDGLEILAPKSGARYTTPDNGAHEVAPVDDPVILADKTDRQTISSMKSSKMRAAHDKHSYL